MFAVPFMYKLGAIALAVSLAAATGIWYVNSVEKRGDVRGYSRAVGEYTALALKATEVAREREQFLQMKVQEAKDAATKRERILQADSRNLRGELSRLQNELAAATRDLPEDTSDAVRARVAALHIILAECAGTVEELAGKADAHASDTRMMQEAWPQ